MGFSSVHQLERAGQDNGCSGNLIPRKTIAFLIDIAFLVVCLARNVLAVFVFLNVKIKTALLKLKRLTLICDLDFFVKVTVNRVSYVVVHLFQTSLASASSG